MPIANAATRMGRMGSGAPAGSCSTGGFTFTSSPRPLAISCLRCLCFTPAARSPSTAGVASEPSVVQWRPDLACWRGAPLRRVPCGIALLPLVVILLRNLNVGSSLVLLNAFC
jgi:hypothetical protein